MESQKFIQDKENTKAADNHKKEEILGELQSMIKDYKRNALEKKGKYYPSGMLMSD